MRESEGEARRPAPIEEDSVKEVGCEAADLILLARGKNHGEQYNESLASGEGDEIPDKLSDYKLLKEHPALWN
jgi:hypothetical protein